jgi:hypothetical protein
VEQPELVRKIVETLESLGLTTAWQAVLARLVATASTDESE